MNSALEFAQQAFDYIVIGGGTTGLALASLLSLDKDVKIGVVEAGKRKDDDNILVPGLIGKVLNDPEYDWSFLTVPQPYANNRRIPINRGKVLGGTSALNYMAYCRGSRVEQNDWKKLGVKGWGWDTIDRVTKASERWTPPDSETASLHWANKAVKNHGRQGYVKTTAYNYYYDLAKPFFETMNELGVATNHSEASGDLIGVWTYTASIDAKTGARSYSTNAYYDNVSHRPNITVLTDALVTKVHLRSEGAGSHRATGVEFLKDGRLYTVQSRKEVVISTGSLQTPQILELSGIGNAQILNSLGIPVQVDLPGVGENFQDHFVVPMGAELVGKHHLTVDDLSSPAFAAEQMRLFKATATGMLGSTLSTLVFIPARQFIAPTRFSEILSALDIALKSPEIVNSPWKKWYEVQRDWLENDGVAQLEMILFPSWTHASCSREGAKHYQMSVFLQHAWSRGNIHAISQNAEDYPRIDGCTLESPADIDLLMLVEAVKYAFNVMRTGALGALTAEIVQPKPSWSDDEIKEFIRNNVKSAFHPIGTASMLPRSSNGVVDDNLKVYGTSNLRVADASIFPIHLGTHPQATLYGLAHRAAEIINEARLEEGIQARL